MQDYQRKNKKSRVLTPNEAMKEITGNKYIQEARGMPEKKGKNVTVSIDVGLRIVIATFCLGFIIGLFI